MNDFKVLVINESIARSIITDFVTFGLLIACFFVNYNFLGNSTIIILLITGCFILGTHARFTEKVKRMTPDEALEYLKERKENEQI